MPRSMPSKAAALVLLFLLGALGCSSGGSAGALAQIESDASEALQLLAALIDALDPFASPVPPSVSLGDPICSDVSEGQCNVSGTVLECQTAGKEVEILFNACTFNQFGFAGSVNGTLIFDPAGDWPTGSREVEFSSADGMARYAFTLDGSSTTQIFIDDLDRAATYECAGSLVTFIADCELVREEF